MEGQKVKQMNNDELHKRRTCRGRIKKKPKIKEEVKKMGEKRRGGGLRCISG